MAKSTSAQTAIAYVAEVTPGTTPAAPTMSEMRCYAESIELKKTALITQEIKSHRQIQNVVAGMHSVDGTFECEFNDCYDAWLEAALKGTLSGGVIKLGQTVKSFTVERRIINSGWFHRYRGIMPNGLTISMEPDALVKLTFPLFGWTLATPATDALASPTGWLVNNGAGYPSGTTTMLIDGGATNFANLDQFVIYNAASALVQRSEQIYTASSGSGTSVTFAPALDVAIIDNDILHAVKPATVITNSDPMDSFTGAITEGGSSLAIATKIDLEIGQGLDPSKPIGTNITQGLIPGGATVSGTLDLYVENMLLFNKFVTEGYSTLQFAISKGGGATYTWLLPKIKYTGAKINKEAAGGAMITSMPFTAVYDATEATAVKVTKT